MRHYQGIAVGVICSSVSVCLGDDLAFLARRGEVVGGSPITRIGSYGISPVGDAWLIEAAPPGVASQRLLMHSSGSLNEVARNAQPVVSNYSPTSLVGVIAPLGFDQRNRLLADVTHGSPFQHLRTIYRVDNGVVSGPFENGVVFSNAPGTAAPFPIMPSLREVRTTVDGSLLLPTLVEVDGRSYSAIVQEAAPNNWIVRAYVSPADTQPFPAGIPRFESSDDGLSGVRSASNGTLTFAVLDQFESGSIVRLNGSHVSTLISSGVAYAGLGTLNGFYHGQSSPLDLRINNAGDVLVPVRVTPSAPHAVGGITLAARVGNEVFSPVYRGMQSGAFPEGAQLTHNTGLMPNFDINERSEIGFAIDARMPDNHHYEVAFGGPLDAPVPLLVPGAAAPGMPAGATMLSTIFRGLNDRGNYLIEADVRLADASSTHLVYFGPAGSLTPISLIGQAVQTSGGEVIEISTFKLLGDDDVRNDPLLNELNQFLVHINPGAANEALIRVTIPAPGAGGPLALLGLWSAGRRRRR